jgi:2-methylcitrate dehydratase
MTELEARTGAVSLAIALADYARTFAVNSESAIDTARHCLIDALSRGFEALRDPDRASLVGPLVPGAMMPGGARIPGTSLELDPPQAAFCLGAMFCRIEDSDPEPEAPSLQAAASLAALLATADYRARKATMEGTSPPKIRDVLAATVKAVEIQGVLAAQGGYDPTGSAVIRITRLALAAMTAADLGGTQAQIVSALGYACVDGGTSVATDEPYETEHRYWATADAVSRAVRHGCQAMACGRSAHLTPDLPSAGLAGRLMGARASIIAPPCGTGMMGRLDPRQSRQDVEPLRTRFRAAVDRHFPARQAVRIKLLFASPERLDDLPVNELLAALVTNGAR